MTRLTPLAPLALLTLTLAGCRKLEPAPKALDDLFHYLWQNYDEGEDEQLAEAFVNLDKAVDGGVELMEGQVSTLTRDEIGLVGLDHADPSKAQGIFLVNRVDCTLAQITKLVTNPDQDGLYEGTYEQYERTRTGEMNALRQGEVDVADWDVWFQVKLLGIVYEADLEEGARRTPEIDAEASPFGPTLVTRRFMTGPATFEKPDYTYPQDWRLEAYYEVKPGVVVHAAAMWREADFGAIQSSDEGVQRLVLNGMQDWDETSSAHCAEM